MSEKTLREKAVEAVADYINSEITGTNSPIAEFKGDKRFMDFAKIQADELIKVVDTSIKKTASYSKTKEFKEKFLDKMH
jgi:hypothetical protein